MPLFETVAAHIPRGDDHYMVYTVKYSNSVYCSLTVDSRNPALPP